MDSDEFIGMHDLEYLRNKTDICALTDAESWALAQLNKGWEKNIEWKCLTLQHRLHF